MKLAEQITGSLLKDNAITSDEQEIVLFGLENLIGNLLGFFVTLIVGYCFGNILAGLCLWLLVFPLRRKAGGYHADTRGKCMVASTTTEIITFGLLYIPNWSYEVYAAITLLFFGIIFILAPVGNQNKPLDQIEYGVYRLRTRVILVVEGMLFVLGLLLSGKLLCILVTMSFFIVGTALVIGKYKLKRMDIQLE